jgi:hypothetical protein
METETAPQLDNNVDHDSVAGGGRGKDHIGTPKVPSPSLSPGPPSPSPIPFSPLLYSGRRRLCNLLAYELAATGQSSTPIPLARWSPRPSRTREVATARRLALR